MDNLTATIVPLNVSDENIHDPNGARFYQFAIEGIAQSIVGLLGLIGNVTSIIVLFRKDMELKRDFMHILVTLICFDILCIVFNLMIFGFPRLWESYEQKVWPYIIPTVLPLAQIALTGSIYSTLALAIERYISVCHPHYVGYQNCGIMSIAGLILFSVLFNTGRFLEFETQYHEVNQTIFDKELNENITKTVYDVNPIPTDLRKDPIYSKFTMIMLLFLNGLLPLLLLIILNTKIYLAIKERTRRLASLTSRQRRDVAVAGVLVGIILVFLVCHCFKFIVNIYETYISNTGADINEAWTDSLTIVVSMSHLLLTLNSSLNFGIYCYKDEKFRSVFLNLVFNFWKKSNNNGSIIIV